MRKSIVLAGLFLVLFTAGCTSVGSPGILAVKVGGATQLFSVNQLSTTLFELSAGKITGQSVTVMQPGYDLNFAKIDGCSLYLSVSIVGQKQIGGGACFGTTKVLEELRNGRLPLPLYVFLGEDPYLQMQYTGEDGWLKTENFDFVRLLSVMGRYQGQKVSQLITVYNSQVTIFLTKISNICLWHVKVTDSIGTLAEGEVFQCGETFWPAYLDADIRASNIVSLEELRGWVRHIQANGSGTIEILPDKWRGIPGVQLVKFSGKVNCEWSIQKVDIVNGARRITVDFNNTINDCNFAESLRLLEIVVNRGN